MRVEADLEYAPIWHAILHGGCRHRHCDNSDNLFHALQTQETLRKSTKVKEHLYNSMKINENNWKPLEIIEHQ